MKGIEHKLNFSKKRARIFPKKNRRKAAYTLTSK